MAAGSTAAREEAASEEVAGSGTGPSAVGLRAVAARVGELRRPPLALVGPATADPSRRADRARRHGAAGSRGTATGERAPVAAVVAVVALLVLGWPLAGLVGGTGASAATSSPPRDQGSVHLVQPGETYWSIAEGLGHPGDLRPTVDALAAANAHRPLRAGDRIIVPAID